MKTTLLAVINHDFAALGMKFSLPRKKNLVRNTSLSNHSKVLGVYSKVLGVYSKVLSVYSKVLGVYSKVLSVYSKVLSGPKKKIFGEIFSF